MYGALPKGVRYLLTYSMYGAADRTSHHQHATHGVSIKFNIKISCPVIHSQYDIHDPGRGISNPRVPL